jgi:hypothetical protein
MTDPSIIKKDCMETCYNVDITDRDSCYSQCVFLYDFIKCMGRKIESGATGNPQCQPRFFGPDASRYGELPKTGTGIPQCGRFFGQDASTYGELPKTGTGIPQCGRFFGQDD